MWGRRIRDLETQMRFLQGEVFRLNMNTQFFGVEEGGSKDKGREVSLTTYVGSGHIGIPINNVFGKLLDHLGLQLKRDVSKETLRFEVKK